MRHLAIPALLAVAAVSSLQAEDMNVADLRFTGGILSNTFDGGSSTTVTDSGGNVVSNSTSSGSSRDSDTNLRGSVGVMFGHLGPGGGLVFGADFAVNHATFKNSGADAHATTPLVDISLGYGLALAPVWHLELTGFVGAGRTYYSVSDNGSTSTSKEWTKYVEFGGKLGSYWTLLPSHFQLGVEGLYLDGRFKPDYSTSDSGGNTVSVSDDRKNRGFGIQAVVGVRF
jgi:hypothetical protein